MARGHTAPGDPLSPKWLYPAWGRSSINEQERQLRRPGPVCCPGAGVAVGSQGRLARSFLRARAPGPPTGSDVASGPGVPGAFASLPAQAVRRLLFLPRRPRTVGSSGPPPPLTAPPAGNGRTARAACSGSASRPGFLPHPSQGALCPVSGALGQGAVRHALSSPGTAVL